MTGPAHHRPGGGFRNPWPTAAMHGPGALARWMLWERLVHPRRPDPPPGSFPRAAPAFDAPRADPARTTITWVGHSSFLVQIGGANVLVDPVWSERASPVAFAGPRRWMPPGIPFDALPPVDVVLLSHNHYDHLDAPTLRRIATLRPHTRWIAPLGVGTLLRRLGARDIVERDWWEETEAAGEGFACGFACAPAQHFSARGPGDRDATLWASWSIAGGGRRLYFGGDSGWFPGYAEIARRQGPFDVAMIPAGAYEPRWFMKPVHMDPDEAVRACRDLLAGSPAGWRMPMVPMHWGTFKLTDEPLDEPPRRVREAWGAAGLAPADLWLMAHGETRALQGR